MSDRTTASILLGITLLIVWGLITHGTFAGSGDEPHYLMIARSVAFDGDLDLTNDYSDSRNLIGAGTLEPGLHVHPGRDGVLRPVHDVGLPLLAAPVLRVAYPLAEWLDATVPRDWLTRAKLNASLILRHEFSLLMAIIAGLIAIEVWRPLVKHGIDRRRAFWWALLVTVSPPLLSYSFLFYTELVAALIVLVCLRRIQEPWVPTGALLTGVLVGLLTFIHIRNAPISLALAAVAVVTHRREFSALALFAIGVGAIAAVRTALNWQFWGTPISSPHVRFGGVDTLEGTLREIGVRASGLLFDQEFGLLTLAPIYLLTLPGFVLLWRRRPLLAGVLTVVVGAGLLGILLPYLNVHGWTGAWSPAPRFLVPLVPLFAVLTAIAGTAMTGRRAFFVTCLIALQIVINVLVWNEPKVLWETGDGMSEIVRVIPSLGAFYATLPAWHGPLASPWPFVAGAVAWGAISAWLSRSGVGHKPWPYSAGQSPRGASD